MEVVLARAVDGDDVEAVASFEVRPEAGVAGRRDEDGVAGIAEHIEEGLEHGAGAGEHGHVLRRHRSAEESLAHELTEASTEVDVADHGVVPQCVGRWNAAVGEPGEEQVEHELVLRNAHADVAVGVLFGMPAGVGAGEVLAEVLRQRRARGEPGAAP